MALAQMGGSLVEDQLERRTDMRAQEMAPCAVPSEGPTEARDSAYRRTLTPSDRELCSGEVPRSGDGPESRSRVTVAPVPRPARHVSICPVYSGAWREVPDPDKAMARKRKPNSPVDYIRRLGEDQHVQEQLRDAASGARNAFERVRRRRGQAAEDKRFYDNLRQTATSIRKAVNSLQRPKPQPKRRMRKVAAAGVAAAGGAVAVRNRRQAQGQTPSSTSTEASSGGRSTTTEQSAAPPGD